jgi:cell division cycle 2-like protein
VRIPIVILINIYVQVKTLMRQLLGAINHMHQRWYIHRDLKTSNLLYSNKEKKLAVCDFGLARKYGRYRLQMND